MSNEALGYILIVVGFLFLAGELAFPTHGVLIAAGVFVDIIGLGMVFYYGGQTRGFVTLAIVSLTMPMAAAGLFYLWPRTPVGRRLIMRQKAEQQATIATLPGVQELEMFRGRTGKAISTLRPSGVVEFDGQRVDCLSEGMLIDPDTWVRCIDVKAGRVVVRPIEPPKLTDLESASFD